MPKGVVAVVPLTFRPTGYEERHFVTGFRDNYAPTIIEGEKMYIIKHDILLSNYKAFLAEFYDTIEEDLNRKLGFTSDNIPTAETLEEFMDVFNIEKRDFITPLVSEDRTYRTRGCDCYEYWLFFCGSHRPNYEPDDTLLHFEKSLSKAMKNPLAKSIKLGVFGVDFRVKWGKC